MSRYVFKLPDLGEGTVEAELSAWHVKPGDVVKEDQLVAEVMTEKAAVELPAPVSGRVVKLAGEPGEMLKVGAELIVFDTSGGAVGSAGVSASGPAAHSGEQAADVQAADVAEAKVGAGLASTAVPQRVNAALATAPAANSASANGRVMASPATRRRAHEAGIDLATIHGTGPGGRIVAADVVAAASAGVAQPAAQSSAAGRGASVALAARQGTEEIRIIGLRRLIAQRMSEAKRTIPHFSYVEEVDITELEALRAHLNEKRDPQAGSLSYLPFIIAALVRVLEKFPQCNAVYDAQREVLVRHQAVHVGIATQTPEGLLVPVLRHAESLSIDQIAHELRELAARARARKSPREELTGSTITVTSLGKLGGIASTPVINLPEVAIIGINKASERPVIRNGAVVARLMMNLSSSFDHRFVDGYDAAAMIQALKELLEHPPTIFMRG